MEILKGILCLVKIAEIVFFIREKLDNHEEVADFLKSIGVLIEEVGKDLESGSYPHNKCSQMEFHLHNLDNTIKKHLPETYYKIAQRELQSAYNVELLFGQFNELVSAEAKETNLNMLKHVSGTFIALSDTIRLKK